MPRTTPVCLDHLRLLSDETGLIQHATYSVARRESGYTTDDNARALVVTAREACPSTHGLAADLAHIYLAFLSHAQREDGRLHNFLSYDRRWQDEVGSEDCQGRAAWGCAEVMSSVLPEGHQSLAAQLLDRLAPQMARTTSPRGAALMLIALCRLPEARQRPSLDLTRCLAQTLVDHYLGCRHHDWAWFEPVITYANARLPQGMLAAHHLTGDERYLQIGLECLDFLANLTIRDGVFVPIGNRRWYARGAQRSEYDQQPIEAACMVSAAAAAWRATGQRRYRAVARLALAWFHGRNTKGKRVADPARGSCHDGLNEEGLNLNEGAESTVMYLLALQDYAAR